MLVFREAADPHRARLLDPAEEHDSGRLRAVSPPVWKLSVPTPFGWYFINIRAGRERRALKRLVGEGQASLAKISVAYTLAVWVMLGLILLGVMVGVYMLKSLAGIDLFDGASFLHDFMYPPGTG